MISDEEKARIRAEEVYREEVRRELDNRCSQRASARQRIWDFLNSALGLWFLTTVVVSFGTWIFTEWSETRASERRNKQAIEQIDLEIATRLDHFANTVNDLIGFKAYSEALAALENPARSVFAASGYPEYRERGLSSLIRELNSRVTEREKPELIQALLAAQQLARISASNLERRLAPPTAEDDSSINFEQLQKVFQLINGPLHRDRWPANRLK